MGVQGLWAGSNCGMTGKCDMPWERIPASWGALPPFFNMWYPTRLSVAGPQRPFGCAGTAPKHSIALTPGTRRPKRRHDS